MRNSFHRVSETTAARNRRNVIACDRSGAPNPYRDGLHDVRANQPFPKDYNGWSDRRQLQYERGRLAAAAAIGRGEKVPKWQPASYPQAVARLFDLERDGLPSH